MIGLETSFWGNTLAQWVAAVCVVLAGVAVLYLGAWFIRHRLANRSEKRTLSALALDLAAGIRVPLLLPLAIALGVQTLVLPSGLTGTVRTIALVGVLLQAAVWAEHAITVGADHYKRVRPEGASTIAAFMLLTRLVLWAVLILLLLDNVGIDVTAIVAGLGIGGVAVALAAQNILGDLFSSLSIMIDRPFVVGDFIIVGDEMGAVEHIGLKTTRVRSLSGEQLIFSNADILQSRIRNYQRLQERRVLFTIGVVYQTSYEVLAGIPDMLREIVESQDDVRFDRAHFARYADSSLDFEVVYYVLAADYNYYMTLQERINLMIFRRFSDAGIEFAYPSRTLYVQDAAGPRTALLRD